jgi:hypothetical protein
MGAPALARKTLISQRKSPFLDTPPPVLYPPVRANQWAAGAWSPC